MPYGFKVGNPGCGCECGGGGIGDPNCPCATTPAAVYLSLTDGLWSPNLNQLECSGTALVHGAPPSGLIGFGTDWYSASPKTDSGSGLQYYYMMYCHYDEPTNTRFYAIAAAFVGKSPGTMIAYYGKTNPVGLTYFITGSSLTTIYGTCTPFSFFNNGAISPFGGTLTG